MNKAALWGFTFGIILIILGAGVYAIVMHRQQDARPRRAPVRAPAQKKEAFPERPPVQKAKQRANLAPSTLEMTRSLSDGGAFKPGSTVDVTVSLTKQGEEPVRAIGIVETIPDGWTYQEMASEERPDLTPSRGHDGRLEFVWFSIPEFPAAFTYRVKAPANATESGIIRGKALYRTSGPELKTEEIKSVLAPAGAGSAPEKPAATPSAAQAEETPAAPEKRATGPELVLSRAIEGEGYTAGEPLEVHLKMEYPLEDRVTALAVQEVLPVGWTFGKIAGGDGPAVPPDEGMAGTINFVWIQLPEWPIEFSYTVNVPQGQSGTVQFEGHPVYRTSGGELHGNTAETELGPAS